MQAAIALPRDAAPGAGGRSRRPSLQRAYDRRSRGATRSPATAAKVPGVVSGDLGEADMKDLAPAFRQAAESLQVGQVSAPIRTDAGLHLVALCSRRHGGADQMTRDQIENRLYGQELAMIAKRQLRDLRNSATIETR